MNVLGAVAGYVDEPEHLEHGFEYAPFRCGELDELEAVEAQGIVRLLGHGHTSLQILEAPW